MKVVVVAPSYRLAPENRLPTAYNDGITTLLWLQKQVGKHAIIKHNLTFFNKESTALRLEFQR